VTLLRQGGWTRWPTEVPSNPYYSVILWFCDSVSECMQFHCGGQEQAKYKISFPREKQDCFPYNQHPSRYWVKWVFLIKLYIECTHGIPSSYFRNLYRSFTLSFLRLVAWPYSSYLKSNSITVWEHLALNSVGLHFTSLITCFTPSFLVS